MGARLRKEAAGAPPNPDPDEGKRKIRVYFYKKNGRHEFYEMEAADEKGPGHFSVKRSEDGGTVSVRTWNRHVQRPPLKKWMPWIDYDGYVLDSNPSWCVFKAKAGDLERTVKVLKENGYVLNTSEPEKSETLKALEESGCASPAEG